MPRAGPAAHSRPSDERTTFVDAHGHAWVRLDTVDGLVLAEPGLAALPVSSALGGVAVEALQIQFIDAVVFEQFQFLDKFMVGSLLCSDSCHCSLGCSTLTVSIYLRDAVAGPLHGALLRNAWLDSVCLFCDSSGCFGCIASIFYVKGTRFLWSSLSWSHGWVCEPR